jgi:hypothetical protein
VTPPADQAHPPDGADAGRADYAPLDQLSPDAALPVSDPRSFYGIAWRGTPADNLRYAVNMGYDYVFYQPGMEIDPRSQGLRYYLESPDLAQLPVDPEINLQKQYSPSEIAAYEPMACWKSNDPFPKNLATGWPRNATQFNMVIDDVRIFASGIVSHDGVGSTSPSHGGEAINRTIAAKAAINGAWFNWYGRFGGSKVGDMPNYQNIFEVPARHQLIRVLPGWDNLRGVPLGARSWDGTTYRSPNSFASPEVIYSRHPKTGRLFVVFLQPTGVVQLQAGETALAASTTDAMFVEQGSAAPALDLSDSTKIRTNALTQLGQGYVVKLSTSK